MASYLEDLRGLEQQIAAFDNEVVDLTVSLKAAKKARDRVVERLREAVREGKVIGPPLLELVEDEA